MVLRSLYSKITLGTVSILLMTVAAIGVSGYLITRFHLEKSKKSELEFHAMHFKRDFTDMIEIKKHRLMMISQADQFAKYYENYRELVLRKHFMNFTSEFPVLSYVDDNGVEDVKVVNGMASDNLTDYSEKQIFEDSMWNPGRVVIEPVIHSKELGELSARFALTKFNYFGDEFQGMLIAHVPFSLFMEYLTSIRIGDRGAVSLMSDKGIVLAQSRGEFTGRKFSVSERSLAAVNRLRTGFLRAEIMGSDSLFAFTPVDGTNWYVLVSIPYDEFYAVSDKLISTVAVISLVIFFIVILVASFMSRRIVKPIQNMAETSKEIAGGAFKRRVDILSNDEIGEFAGNFNHMMDKVDEFNESLHLEIKYVENLMGSMLNAIIVMDLNMNIIEVNESACTMLAYSKEELISRPYSILTEEDTESIKNRLLKNHIIRNEESTLFKKLGDMIYTLMSFSFVETNERDDGKILCVAEDITDIKIAEQLLQKAHDDLELKVHKRTAALIEVNSELEEEIAERNRAEAALVKTNEKLQIINRELQEFVYVASHDLQEPLRKIATFGDRLKDKCAEGLGEQGNDYLQRMQSSASRMNDLISSLLIFSRITTSARPFEQVDLNRVVEEVLSDLEVRIEQTEGRVEVSGLATIDADFRQMSQVFQNLISNALKFRKRDVSPVVKIYGTYIHGNGSKSSKAQSRRMYKVIVQDNGIGFNEKYLEKIFGVFQRLHGRKEYDGTGIGLSICRKIAERHGGSITAESMPGEGSSFIITLPAHHAGQGD